MASRPEIHSRYLQLGYTCDKFTLSKVLGVPIFCGYIADARNRFAVPDGFSIFIFYFMQDRGDNFELISLNFP